MPIKVCRSIPFLCDSAPWRLCVEPVASGNYPPRLTELKLGLVVNFGERLVRDGIHRVVNGL